MIGTSRIKANQRQGRRESIPSPARACRLFRLALAMCATLCSTKQAISGHLLVRGWRQFRLPRNRPLCVEYSWPRSDHRSGDLRSQPQNSDAVPAQARRGHARSIAVQGNLGKGPRTPRFSKCTTRRFKTVAQIESIAGFRGRRPNSHKLLGCRWKKRESKT